MERIEYMISKVGKKEYNLDLILNHFPKFLKQYRAEMGLTYAMFADLIGTSTSFVFRVIQGKRNPNFEFIITTLWKLDFPEQLINDLVVYYLKSKHEN